MGSGAVCYAAPLTVHTLQWISTISSAVLLLAKGTAVQKSFLVPLFVLQAPSAVISWFKGEYGIWTAFLALLVRLFFFIPAELELPLVALLLVIVAPYQVTNIRGRQEGAIISLVIAAYLAFQHFSRIGTLQKSFDRENEEKRTDLLSSSSSKKVLVMARVHVRSDPKSPVVVNSSSMQDEIEVAELGDSVGSEP
ncbi:cold regulated 314 thylakoid membrane 2 [Prunus dulcis]|uniref:Cold regulated 314 thylakoid membrane 2 n=1 Tax=Prunus dulcis TaxID=3755 RepID=A0A4Y1RB16_PRUDU|nr:cold regulated 314 thylakoid membrane 2 [Prunus dulcis]